MSFFIAFAFLPDESETSYSWALEQIKGLYNRIYPMIALTPEAISTDCDQALRNAISKIFPESAALLCLWYTNKNIIQYCKSKFTTTEDYNDFFRV